MFNTKIPLYGILIVIALISGLVVIYINAKNLKYKNEEIISLLAYIILGAVLGAKYYTFFANFNKYYGIFNFKKIGLSSYGAVIGIILLLLVFSKQFKKSITEMMNIVVPALPLMYGIGKIGCFLAGCCHGIEYSGIFKVTYNYSYSAMPGISYFPIQIVESIVFILIFICTYIIQRKGKINNKIIGLIIVLCGISKFTLDFLRISHIGKILSINQIVSIIFILIGIFIMIKSRRKEGQKNGNSKRIIQTTR